MKSACIAINTAIPVQCNLPNWVMMWMSWRKWTNLWINKSHILFELDTFVCNNILLDSAKYYILDFTIFLLPHSVYGGVLELY